MTALFVTGTDTNVGKTWVGCAIAAGLRARGRSVAVLKPVETGVDGHPADARRLAAAAGDPAPLDDLCPYRLRAPMAPTAAAAREGVTLDVDGIVALVERRRRAADVLLVEGAGGLLVPLAGRTTWCDIAARCRLPVLIVAADRLGTINHTALTARVAEAAGLAVRGFVLSQPGTDTDPTATTNAAEIAALTGLRCLGTLPHAPAPDPAAVDLDRLFPRLEEERT